MDPALATGFAETLENVINTALRYDPSTVNKLRKLGGSLIQCEFQMPHFSLYFEVENEVDEDRPKLKISTYSERPVNARLSGSLIDFLLFFARSGIDESHNLSQSGLRVTGNSAKLASFQSVFKNLDIDWEQALINLASPFGETGKVASFQFTQVLKQIVSWKNNTKNSFKKNFESYLSEELKVLPTQTELNTFYSHVNSLRADGERLRAKVSQLSLIINKDNPGNR